MAGAKLLAHAVGRMPVIGGDHHQVATATTSCGWKRVIFYPAFRKACGDAENDKLYFEHATAD